MGMVAIEEGDDAFASNSSRVEGAATGRAQIRNCRSQSIKAILHLTSASYSWHTGKLNPSCSSAPSLRERPCEHAYGAQCCCYHPADTRHST